MKMAVAAGRAKKPKLKIGICGEHGGDPNSIEFCSQIGLDYVSCSPLRVPIARLAAAQAAGVRRYLRQSIAFWAVPGPGLADEETPLAFDASPAVAADARVVTELEHRLLGNPNMEGIALRYGFFYGPGTWFNPDGDVAQQVRRQQFPIIGNGEGVWSWLHIEDAAIATVAAAEQGNPGIYLIANDQPLAVREWLPAFARWLNAPPPLQLSVEDALKQDGGPDTVYYGTRVRGVSNAKAKRELAFQPRPLE
jgi:nucleoside-diphosphate-sugar epimerase